MKNLKQRALETRLDIIKMIFTAQSGHPGSSLSCVEILTTLFFNGFIKQNPEDPKWEERDYFVLSKGHAAPTYYAILSELGYFEKEHLYELRQVNALLQGHPNNNINGVEVCTGSLGQGLSVANGIAIGLKIDQKNNKVFSVHGDGEMQEGQIWEAIMTANKYKLDNLVTIIDKNNLQIDGSTHDVCDIGNLKIQFESFGWEVFECDGHDFQDLEKTLNEAIAIKGSPTVIIAKTVKGKGVSFMENQVGWHGKAPNQEEFEMAIKELGSML